jgi:hypothetical protein
MPPLIVMGMLVALGKMNFVSGNLPWERHCCARKDLSLIDQCPEVGDVGCTNVLTILRRYSDVSTMLDTKDGSGAVSPVSEAVGDDDGRCVPPKCRDYQSSFSRHCV